jgi:hypothetical protein
MGILTPFRRHDDGEREYAQTPVKEIPSGAAGTDGDQYSDSYQGMSGGADLNPQWSGRAKYDVIEEMRKSDPAIHSLLWMFKLPYRQANWDHVPFQNGDDPIDLLIAEACDAQFGLGDYEGWLDLSHDELLTQDSLMLDFGAMFEEIVPGDPVEWSPLGDSSVSRIIRPFSRLAPRYPATVEKIETDKRTGRIRTLEQDLEGARPIPGEWIVPYVLDREADWFGTSLLRYCYGAWRMKKALLISAAIGWDRYSSGIPVVHYPPGKKAEAISIGRNIRTHERGYVALEGPPVEAGGEWGFRIESGASSLADPVNLLRHYDLQIASAGLQGWKELGNTSTGSRATADVVQNPYWKAVEAFAHQIAMTRRKYVLRKFVDVNFGTEYHAPELRVSKIEAKDILALSTVIANLSSANLTFTDRDTQNDIRDRLELTHLPEEVATPLEQTVNGLPDNVGVQPTLTVPPEGSSINPAPTNPALAPARG